MNIILRVLSNAQGYPRTRETRVDRQKVNKHSHKLIEKTSLKLKCMRNEELISQNGIISV